MNGKFRMRKLNILIMVIILLILIFTCKDPSGFSGENKLNKSELDNVTSSFYSKNSNILGSLHRIDKIEYRSWSNSHGYMDLSKSKELSPDAVFAIGSITKTYTATLILQLMEKGLIYIENLAIDYLPTDFKAILESMEYGADVKVIHLLNHTSGIFSYTWIEEFYLDRYADLSAEISPVNIMEYVTEYGWFVNFPGTEYHYSNTNYVILGKIIEHITGIAYREVLEEKIIHPLNLSNTFLAEGMLSDYQRDIIHGYDVDYGEVYDIHQFNFDATCWSAGGIISNTKDLNKFITALCKNELYSNENTFQIMLDLNADDTYGLGIFKNVHPVYGEYYGHGGGHQGTNSIAYYFPSQEFAYSSCITINDEGGYVNPDDELILVLNALKFITL
jgi:D-alanyl-D-alanine carboxypeptidase